MHCFVLSKLTSILLLEACEFIKLTVFREKTKSETKNQLTLLYT